MLLPISKRKKGDKMLKIYVSKLSEQSKELKNLVDQYEETAMTIFQEISNAEFSWHDDNSGDFFDGVSSYKAKLKAFIEDLENTSKKYEQIVESANKIKKGAEVLYCNQNYRTSVRSSFDNSISHVNSIRSQLNNLSTYFCTYNERQTIRNEIGRLDGIASRLNGSKKYVDDLFGKLIALENEISTKLSKIDITKIGTYEFERFMLR